MYWLAGEWQLQNKNGTEVWQVINNSQLSGEGFIIRDGKKESTEKMKLIGKDSKFFFVADVPHNQKEVFFEIINWNKNGFIAENQQHDFPKKIIYKIRKGLLHVTISSGKKQQVFIFEKVHR
jgi:Domain of unknown function (DUF6265)